MSFLSVIHKMNIKTRLDIVMGGIVRCTPIPQSSLSIAIVSKIIKIIGFCFFPKKKRNIFHKNRNPNHNQSNKKTVNLELEILFFLTISLLFECKYKVLFLKISVNLFLFYAFIDIIQYYIPLFQFP